MKKLISCFCIAAFMFSFAGCSKTEEPAPTEPTQQTTQTQSDEQQPTQSSGNKAITMAGSTSMEKFANGMNEAFMAANNNEITAQAEFTGSGAGIEAVSAGTVDIGNASRALKEEEKAKGIVENVVAIDGIGVVVDKANMVTDITKEDLVKIYKGEITNWKELGGVDQPIIVIGREAGSGTRGAFEELLEIVDVCKYAQEIDSTGAVLAKVASTPGAIGYVSVDIIDDTVTALKLNGVEPTTENIKTGSYELSRPFVMATKGAISDQKEEVQKYFEFIDSEEGQKVIEKVGLISAKQ